MQGTWNCMWKLLKWADVVYCPLFHPIIPNLSIHPTAHAIHRWMAMQQIQHEVHGESVYIASTAVRGPAEAEFIIPFIIMQSVFTIFIYLKKLNQDCNFYLHSNFTVNLNNTSGPPRLTPTNIKKQHCDNNETPTEDWACSCTRLGFPQFNKLTQRNLCLFFVFLNIVYRGTYTFIFRNTPGSSLIASVPVRSVEWLSDGVNSWLQVNKKWQRQ